MSSTAVEVSGYDVVTFDDVGPATEVTVTAKLVDKVCVYEASTSAAEAKVALAGESFENHLHTSITIPYFAPAADLPAELPSTTEIESSQEEISRRTAVRLVALGQHFVAKYGKGVDLDEAKTMMFVKDYAQFPVPQIYALYSDRGQNFIIMERIQGETLQNRWSTLRDLDKRIIATQIKECLIRLRSIPSSKYCSLEDKPLRDPLFRTVHDDHSVTCEGPFASESDLNNAIIRKCRRSEAMRGKANFYEASLPDVLRDHPPVFTHADLQRKNIMLRTSSSLRIDLVFLDWETAGWYPSYWEYACSIMGCGLFDDEWHQYINVFLEPCQKEYAWLHMLANELCY